MMNRQLNQTAYEPKPDLFAGIDVGAEELVLVIRKNGKCFNPQTVANTSAGHARLVKKLIKLPGIIICLEATGIYHFDLAIALYDANLSLMVVNPKSSHNFSKVLMNNSKTDAVDAQTLAEYAARMEFVAWVRPANEMIALRGFARRIDALTSQKAAAKNQLHALNATQETPKAVLRDAKLAISQLEKRIHHLTTETLTFIDNHPELTRVFQLLISIKGIAETSAIVHSWVNYYCCLQGFLSVNGSSLQVSIRKPSTPVKVSTKRHDYRKQAIVIFVQPCICQR
jgi:transposase